MIFWKVFFALDKKGEDMGEESRIIPKEFDVRDAPTEAEGGDDNSTEGVCSHICLPFFLHNTQGEECEKNRHLRDEVADALASKNLFNNSSWAAVRCEDCEIDDGSRSASVPLENLWLCLECAHVSCGRYGHEHALRHSEKTSHPAVIALASSLIWCYKCDNEVFELSKSSSSESLDKEQERYSGDILATLRERVRRICQGKEGEGKESQDATQQEDCNVHETCDEEKSEVVKGKQLLSTKITRETSPLSFRVEDIHGGARGLTNLGKLFSFFSLPLFFSVIDEIVVVSSYLTYQLVNCTMSRKYLLLQ